MRTILLLIFTTCFFSLTKSQEIKKTLSGDIYGKQSVGYARVYISSLNNKILGFAFANENGHYTVEFITDKDSVYLNISRIGYETKKIKISSETKYLRTELLISDKTEFKEIVVTAEKKAIMERGDTISYAVSKFSDGTEVNAEDILSKLPGVSVDSKTGKIKYQGKEIKKILLDGDDLTDNNYKVLSKSLAAEWLDEVDILQHFTDSRLYHGIKQSEEIAINIKLKEEAKAPLFGSVEAGAGGWKKPDKYYLSAELLSYLKKFKIFAHSEQSNTGVDIEAYSMETYMSSQLEYKGFLSARPYLNDKLYPPDFFKEEFFTFNNGEFLSNSMIFKPKEKTSIKSVTTLYHNSQNYDFSNYVKYLFPDNIYSFSERQIQQQKELNLFQDLKIEHQISKSQDIITRFQIKKNTNKLNTKNYSDSLNNIASLSNTDNLELFASLSYINKFAKNWVSTTDFEIGNENFKENFHFDSLVTQQAATIGLQNTIQPYINIGLSTELNGVLLNNLYSTISFAWVRTGTKISANTQGVENKKNLSSFYTYTINNFSGEILLDKKIKIFKFSAAGRLRNALIEYNNVENVKILFEPTISILIDKKFDNLLTIKFKALYNIEYSFIKPYHLIDIPLFTNYRTINSFNASPFEPGKNNINTALIEIRENRKTYITAHAKWIYILSDNVLTDNINYPFKMEYNQKLQNGSSTEFVAIYSISKYFEKIKSSIKISYNQDNINSPLSINNYLSTNKTDITNFSVTSGTSLIKRKVNLSLAFSQNKTSSVWNNEKNFLNYDRYFIKLWINIHKNISLSGDYNTLYFKDLQRSFSLLNSVLKINTTKKKFSYIIKCNNILDNKAVKILYLKPSYYAATNYPLQERFLIATIKYRF